MLMPIKDQVGLGATNNKSRKSNDASTGDREQE
jgi:hypothetical protein